MPKSKPRGGNAPRAVRKKKLAATKVERPFPRASISEAIRIPLALKEYNGGNPWPPNEVRQVVDSSIGNSSVQSNHYYYLTSASRDFGFTSGTLSTSQIQMTELGRSFAYAGSKEAELEAMRRAFLSVDLFAKVLDHYGSGALPEKKYVANTLVSQFGLPDELHDEFLELFRENVRFLQIDDKSQALMKESSRDGEVAAGIVLEIEYSADSDLVVVAEPEVETDRTLFVAIPFGEKTDKYHKGFFAEVLRSLIGPAGAAAGFKVVTANRKGSDIIQSTIVNGLLDADLVLADLTEHNPNVLFELGLRMSADQPVALIRAEGTLKIFDVDNMLRVFDYSPNLWKSTIAGDLPNLTAHIKASWDRRNSDRTYMKILRGRVAESK